MARRVMMGAYGAWMIALGLIYFVVATGATASAVVWAVIGLSSTLAILAGVWLYRPRRIVPWLLLAGAVCAYAAGDLIYDLTQPYGAASSWQHVDDAFYVVTVVLLLTGLIQLARSAGPDRDATIDALILMVGLGILTWIFLVDGADGQEGDRLDAITTIAYPMADVVVLAAVTRLLSATRWTPTATLLLAGTVGTLVSDTVYRLTRTEGTWSVPRVVGLGWFLFYACWGAAALHPSMRELSEPRTARPRATSPMSLALLTLSAMIPPAVLLYEAVAHGPVKHGVVIAFASATMFLLVLVRLAGVGGKLRERIARERGLRAVIAALVSAADTAGVTTALHTGVGQLMPSAGHKQLLLLSPADDLAGPPLAGLQTDQLMATAALPGPVARQLGAFATTLACPMVLPDHSMGEEYLGVLLIAAPEPSLAGARDSLAVLASQAALAIDRVALSRELIRRNSEEYFRALIHHTADVILILGEDDGIRYASPSASAVFGTANLVGTHLLDHIDEADRDTADQALAIVRAGSAVDPDDSAGGGGDWTVHARDGTPVHVEASWRDLRTDPSVRGIVVTLRDVTEQRRLERELTHRAYHDGLTGLANRVLFAERVQDAITRTHHTGGVAGVLFIDLDDFKVVNDTLGHEFGDELLIAIAHRVTQLIRPRDTAARLGGDEFAVLVEDARDAASVEEIAARIATALKEPFSINGHLLNGMASIGIGTTSDADDGPELLRQADLALYVAKDAGKGQWRRYRPHLHLAVEQRLALRADLDTAISSGQLAVDYQPIVALADGSTIGFEALVRWNHPTRGRLQPDDFIDIAEETGLVAPIGDWVLRTSLATAGLWRDSWPDTPPYVSVNVSVQQFRSPGFVARVARELAVSGVPATCLMVEITESLLLRDDDQVWDDLAELRQLGVRVAIDDFGTGYSSLSYLRHVPLDVLKIDRLFTAAISTSPQQYALVDGILRLARTLGLQVVAEGVETPAERELLTRIGCPYGQGFLFSRPMPLADTLQWLQQREGDTREATRSGSPD